MDASFITAVDWSQVFDCLAVVIGAITGALFATAGTLKAWNADVGIVLAIVLGTVTAVGGGALRDICTGETPVIFKPGTFYAISAFLGSALFVACELLGAPVLLSSVACVALSFALTLLSRRFNWRTKHSAP